MNACSIASASSICWGREQKSGMSSARGHRLGQLKLEQQWDAIALVIMDADFETDEIYLAEREAITESINNSKNKRGSISVARFKIIGELLWSAENGIENDGYWSNAD